MSDLYRSALQTRIAKLPDLGALGIEDEDEEEETDGLGDLPNGMGPPAMCALIAPRTIDARIDGAQ
jgi:protein phosphatase methylesterase 1